MKIIQASATIVSYTQNLEQLIELSGRVCYKSEHLITQDSSTKFITRLKESKHESVMEHGAITVKFIVDRGISHELVRHRLASFSQESTRYCNYSKDKFNNQLTFIDPRPAFPNMTEHAWECWNKMMIHSEIYYLLMINNYNSSPQEGRSVLPNSLKTEVMMTANPREWLHIFKLRCAKESHPQMREVMIPLHNEFINRWPLIFG